MLNAAQLTAALSAPIPLPQAYTYVAVWIALSGAVIMYNKYLLAYYGFPFPITLTMWCVLAPHCCCFCGVAMLGTGAWLLHSVAAILLCPRCCCTLICLHVAHLPRTSCRCPAHICRAFSRPACLPAHRHMFFCAALAIGLVKSGKVQATSMDRDTYVRAIVPIGACYAITLWVGNAAYLYLSVSFIQMLKVGAACGCCLLVDLAVMGAPRHPTCSDCHSNLTHCCLQPMQHTAAALLLRVGADASGRVHRGLPIQNRQV